MFRAAFGLQNHFWMIENPEMSMQVLLRAGSIPINRSYFSSIQNI